MIRQTRRGNWMVHRTGRLEVVLISGGPLPSWQHLGQWRSYPHPAGSGARAWSSQNNRNPDSLSQPLDGEEAWHQMAPDRDEKEKQNYEQADLERIRAKLFSSLKISAFSIVLAIAILAALTRLSPELLPEALVRMLP